MNMKLVDKLTDMDRAVLPLHRLSKYVSDNGLPPTLVETHLVHDKDGNVVCECKDKAMAEYIVNSMNMMHFSKKTALARGELKDEVIGTIVIDGEVVPKDEKKYPVMGASATLVEYRHNADYRRYIGKFKKDKAELWTLRDDEPIRDRDVYLVVLFYVGNRFNKNIGDCIATVVDGLTNARIVSEFNRARVSAIAKSAFVRCDRGHRTEIYLMRYGK